MKLYHLFLAGIALLLATGTSSAEIILSEDFSGGSAAALNGTAEDTSGVLWNANPAFGIDGSVNMNRGSALLAFSPEAGFIYTASGTMELFNGDVFNFGFAELESDTNFHNQAGLTGWAFMFTQPGEVGTGGQLAAEGPRNLGDEVLDGEFEFLDEGLVTLDVVLDTTDAIWTADFFVNGNVFTENMQLDGLGVGMINFVGFSAGLNPTGDATRLVSFSLDAVAVPEPSSMAFLAFVGIGGTIAARRKRSKAN